MSNAAILGEQYPAKLAAFLNTPYEADHTVHKLVTQADIPRRQIDVVQPMDFALGRKLEPETLGIVETAIRAHVILGGVGLVVGLLIAGALVLGGVDLAVSSPGYTFFTLGILGTVLGLLAGGLVTARPDHQKVVTDVRDASEHGKWTVVVHAANDSQHKRAKELLNDEVSNVTETL
ncbi:hypothetical protein [Thiosocius teredinicola]|uniref:hypothetical protein n=1 Tax=Thiosocius teredinicola TaxID=1973002 RepID=UPI000990C7AF